MKATLTSVLVIPTELLAVPGANVHFWVWCEKFVGSNFAAEINTSPI